jgi:hypothetical protein
MPVVAGDECVMVLYGDTFVHQCYEDNLRALEILNRHVGTVLENQRLRRKLHGKKEKASDLASPALELRKPKQKPKDWTN